MKPVRVVRKLGGIN